MPPLTKQLAKYISSCWHADYQSQIVWTPVLFATGITIYFALPFEPQLKHIIYFCSAITYITYTTKKKPAIHLIFLTTTIISIGLLTATINTLITTSPIIQHKTSSTQITGRINNIQNLPHGKRFLLDQLTIANISPTNTPKHIRININTNHNNAQIGDHISTTAILSPPPKPIIKDGYNFARNAYFKQIGAIGYAITDITIIKPATKFKIYQYVQTLRQKIINKTLSNTQTRQGNIAIALLVGERSSISKQDLNNIRQSGIAHLLAISGLHLSLVAGIFFFTLRTLLALSNTITLQYNIKKIAASLAIIGSLFYLLISGSPISAQRAFIMTTIILLAIIIDRESNPIRSVALAAMLILIVSPESILTPSFQMSFAAVTTLIATFTIISQKLHDHTKYSLIKNIKFYIFSIIISSFIASLATTPFAIYHFNHFSTWSILTNLIAIPLTTFIIMPSGMLALILMPLNLEALALLPMQLGITIMLDLAQYVTNLPQAIHHPPPFSKLCIILITTGGLWLSLWQKSWRLLGIIPIFIGLITINTNTTPNIIISNNGKLFALKSTYNQLHFSSNTTEKFTRTSWQKHFGTTQNHNLYALQDPKIKCDYSGCIYKHHNHTISLITHPSSLEESCKKHNIVINLTYINHYCPKPIKYINSWDLYNNGTHSIYLTPNNYTIQTSYTKNRPWS